MLGHNWLDIKRKERGTYRLVQARFRPVLCNHCDEAPCIKAARDGAMRKREDGIVIIDPETSKGQKEIVDSCPYGAISWNEEKQIPQASPFDAHLLDEGWTRTPGQQACPTQVFTPGARRSSRLDGSAAVATPKLAQQERRQHGPRKPHQGGAQGGQRRRGHEVRSG